MQGRSSWLSILILALMAVAGLAQEPVAPDKEIVVRLTGGKTFYSNTDPVTGGWGLGGTVQFEVSSGFGLGGSFGYSAGSEYLYQTATSTTTRESITTFGLTPYYGLRRGGVSASVGAFIGAMLISREVSVNSLSNGAQSVSRFALGVNAPLDIPLVGGLSFSIVPEYIHALGGGDNIGAASIRAGFGLSL